MSERAEASTTITVVGEALIDLVPSAGPRSFVASPGGSPYNVAVGLARLGHDTALMARLADNSLGAILRENALAEGIRLEAAPDATEPTTLAVVSLDPQGRAAYDFYRDGTADWQWTDEEITRIPADTAVLHFGSLASWLPPGDQRIAGLARRMRGRGDVLVTYDPNVRPGLLGDPGHGRAMVERGVRIAHMVKASEEDVAWLYPDHGVADVARGWLALETSVVIITRGAEGADAYLADGSQIRRPSRPIAVADTVGAGDSFTAGLISSLIRLGRHTPGTLARCPATEMTSALDDAMAVAALNCQRVGNDPPRRTDLTAAQSGAEPG